MCSVNVDLAYNQTLDYIYSFVDYSLKHASELAKAHFDLGRMRALLAILGNPERRYPVIHIAGTKGKGSVAALCASALRAAGYRTGLYTSPHLQDYTERIQVDGEAIPHADLVALVEEIKPAISQVPYLTTFEITTALGFLHFACRGVEAAVIEVGLGGRLDATNVVTPLVSVITSLSYDHTAVLGDTLAQIAAEKGGIIKPGRPVVSAPQDEEALDVLRRICTERDAPLTLVGREVRYEALSHSLDGQSLRVWNARNAALEVRIPLLGAHQVLNAAVAAAALWTARREGLALSEDAIRRGFATVKWPGRFEVVRREPPVVLDSAHNVDSARKLAQTVKEYFPGWPVVLITGASEDKDIVQMLMIWNSLLDLRGVVVTRAAHPRALEAGQLLERAAQAGVEAEAVMPVEAALARALELAGDSALVLSAGSIFLTAAVRAVWEQGVQTHG